MRHPWYFEPHHREVVEAVGAVARGLDALEGAWRPLGEPAGPDAEDTRARQALAVVAGGGLCRWSVPGPDGAFDRRALCLIREGLGRASGLGDFVFAMQGLGSHPLVLAGTEAQRAQWLPAVARGEAVAAFALTEPGAGSDVAAISTRARREGARWRLDGHKCLISNAGLADLMVVFARTGEDPRGGLSAFVVEKGAPGLTVTRREVMSPHPLGDLHFDGCLLPGDALVGAEGQGFALAMGTLERFRPSVGAAALGMGQRALEEAVTRAQTRHQFGQPLSRQQLIQAKLAKMDLRLEAARLLVYQAALLGDREEAGAARATAQAKWEATEAAAFAIDEAVQIFGGEGVLRGTVVERLYREIRPLRIYEGTSEIQQLILARELFRAARPRGEA